MEERDGGKEEANGRDEAGGGEGEAVTVARDDEQGACWGEGEGGEEEQREHVGEATHSQGVNHKHTAASFFFLRSFAFFPSLGISMKRCWGL